MKRLLTLILGGALCFGQTKVLAPQVLDPVTVSGLPSASSYTNAYVTITNGANACDTTVGGGTTRVLAVSNGSAWSAPNCGGGGSGVAATLVTVTFASTVTFTANSNTSTTFLLTLTGNATSNALAGASTGQIIIFTICQDATGSRTFSPPSNVVGMGAIASTASYCSSQGTRYDGTNAVAFGPMYVTGSTGGAIVMPGSTSGSLQLYPAAVAGTNSSIRFPSGVTDFSATGGTSNVVVQASTGAALTVRQLAASDLSDGNSGTGAICHVTGSSCASSGSAAAPYAWIYGAMSSATVPALAIPSANNVVYWIINVPSPGWVVTKMKGFVDTGAGDIALAFYNSSCSLIQGTNTSVAPGETEVTWTFSPALTLSAGLYYFAYSSTSTGDKIFGTGSSYGGDISNQGLSSPNLNVFYGANNSSTTSNVMTFPSTCGTQTAYASSTQGYPALWMQ